MAKKKKKDKPAVEETVALDDVEQLKADLAQLRADLEAAQAKSDEYLDGWKRSQAEFANYRKRQDADWQRRVQMSNAALIAKILPVLDDLGRALQTLPAELDHLTWVEGVMMIFRKLEKVLDLEGVKPIEAEGQSFDPLYHEAITYEELPGYEDGQVIAEVQRGYMLGDRVIRPALVRVAKAPLPSVEDEASDVPLKDVEPEPELEAEAETADEGQE